MLYQITFKTTDCNGDTGFATVEVNRIHKIQTITCDEPDAKFKKLKQVIVKSKIIPTSFDVFMVTESEAQHIQKRIDDYMEAKRKLLERGNPIILHKE